MISLWFSTLIRSLLISFFRFLKIFISPQSTIFYKKIFLNNLHTHKYKHVPHYSYMYSKETITNVQKLSFERTIWNHMLKHFVQWRDFLTFISDYIQLIINNWQLATAFQVPLLRIRHFQLLTSNQFSIWRSSSKSMQSDLRIQIRFRRIILFYPKDFRKLWKWLHYVLPTCPYDNTFIILFLTSPFLIYSNLEIIVERNMCSNTFLFRMSEVAGFDTKQTAILTEVIFSTFLRKHIISYILKNIISLIYTSRYFYKERSK